MRLLVVVGALAGEPAASAALAAGGGAGGLASGGAAPAALQPRRAPRASRDSSTFLPSSVPGGVDVDSGAAAPAPAARAPTDLAAAKAAALAGIAARAGAAREAREARAASARAALRPAVPQPPPPSPLEGSQPEVSPPPRSFVRSSAVRKPPVPLFYSHYFYRKRMLPSANTSATSSRPPSPTKPLGSRATSAASSPSKNLGSAAEQRARLRASTRDRLRKIAARARPPSVLQASSADTSSHSAAALLLSPTIHNTIQHLRSYKGQQRPPSPAKPNHLKQ